MAELLRLPARETIEPPRIVAGRTAEVVDISRRDIFYLHRADEVAASIAALPNMRDREAALAKIIRDFRKLIRRRHGLAGPPVAGACVAIEARLRRLIREKKGELRHG